MQSERERHQGAVFDMNPRTTLRTIFIAGLASIGLWPAAFGASDRASDIATFLEPAYPVYLAELGLPEVADTGRMKELADKAAAGLTAVTPADCDGAAFKRDFCGLVLNSMPSSAMEPSLRKKELFAVRRYGDGKPQRGDIIIFHVKTKTIEIFAGKTPVVGSHTFAKRVIGLPGDKVELRRGVVYVSGKALVAAPTGQTMQDETGDQVRVLLERTPEGRQYSIEMSDRKYDELDNAGPFVVPQGSYFVIGDNRHDSLDSRVPSSFGDNGFIPAADILGRAVMIFASPDTDRIGSLID
jgi:signal peptidase I